FMEIWNNVFSQFNNDGNGNYTELSQKNIDTGMGLERLACVMQGVDNLFEVDTVRKILNTVCSISGKSYGADAKDDISIRVVTDHIRSATFMICDGVIPSNEGRGYVLRRILRRACRFGKLLGINRAFLCELCEVVIGENINAYPELGEKKDYILKVISIEEERFEATVDAGLSILSDLIRGAIAENADTISGEEVFKLYDTFGFPIDLTREIAAESNLKLDEDTFLMLMQQQKVRAREARANIGGWDESSKSLISDLPKTEFTGYTDYRSSAKVIAILTDEGSVQSVDSGDCSIILDRTPFYGEGGGQVGDTGTIYSDGFLAKVYDTKKTDGVYIHLCTVAEGSISVGGSVVADIEDSRRNAIGRNHSAAHLLQAALRAVLGSHVEQAGSFVNEDVCRFDFTHFSALTSEEIIKIENLVNLNILAANDIVTVETDIETARKNGAMALFGEKYGSVVRMVKMGNFSTELCGGTHCNNTGKIGLFKIISETSVAAGVRRIEAVTGLGVLKLIAEKDTLIGETALQLKVQNPADIAKRAAAVDQELREARKEIEALNAKIASSKLDTILSSAKAVGAYNLICARIDDIQSDAARALADEIKASNPDAVAVLAITAGDKLSFIAVAGKNAVSGGAHAGKLVGAVAAITGGKGGGRPDNAMAGGKELSKIDEALAHAEVALKDMIK
ncbi:MAG: alanine--tRNA ligase, partial [Clostridia bacterium]|nr:alanine--tRNA ligase [Clostridia bacterium]